MADTLCYTGKQEKLEGMAVKKLWITVSIATLLLAATPVIAKTYKCVAENGDVSYSQVQCPEAEKIEQVQDQNPPPRPSVVPVVGPDGDRYYVESDRINIKEPQSSNYYSPENQLKRMERERENKLEKQVAKERRADARRDYKKAAGSSNERYSEYREGRCRYYKSRSRGRYNDDYYKAKRKEFCD